MKSLELLNSLIRRVHRVDSNSNTLRLLLYLHPLISGLEPQMLRETTINIPQIENNMTKLKQICTSRQSSMEHYVR